MACFAEDLAQRLESSKLDSGPRGNSTNVLEDLRP